MKKKFFAMFLVLLLATGMFAFAAPNSGNMYEPVATSSAPGTGVMPPTGRHPGK